MQYSKVRERAGMSLEVVVMYHMWTGCIRPGGFDARASRRWALTSLLRKA